MGREGRREDWEGGARRGGRSKYTIRGQGDSKAGKLEGKLNEPKQRIKGETGLGNRGSLSRTNLNNKVSEAGTQRASCNIGRTDGQTDGRTDRRKLSIDILWAGK